MSKFIIFCIFIGALLNFTSACAKTGSFIDLPISDPPGQIILEGDEPPDIERHPPPQLSVRETIGSAPETLMEAAAALPSYFREDDYHALIGIYMNFEDNRDDGDIIRQRLGDIRRYFYERWNLSSGNTELSRMLQCALPGEVGVDLIFITATDYFDPGDMEIHGHTLPDISVRLVERLSHICSP